VATTSPSSSGPTTSWMAVIRSASVVGRREGLAAPSQPLPIVVTAPRSITVVTSCPPAMPLSRCMRRGLAPVTGARGWAGFRPDPPRRGRAASTSTPGPTSTATNLVTGLSFFGSCDGHLTAQDSPIGICPGHRRGHVLICVNIWFSPCRRTGCQPDQHSPTGSPRNSYCHRGSFRSRTQGRRPP
jgi:hypothetical protein